MAPTPSLRDIRLRAGREYHDITDPHGRGARLAEVILGGQDGLVNVLGVILGVAAATHSARVVLAAGVAAAFAESVSMAAVAYTSANATGARYRSERERELRHIARVPELERDEIRALYRAKGLEGELLERVVSAVTTDPQVWVAVMMAEEHKLAPIDRREALRSAAVVGVFALIGSLVPLLPYVAFAARTATLASVILSAIVLFALGAYKARATVGHPVWSGLELAAIGMTSALIGYGVGALFEVK